MKQFCTFLLCVCFYLTAPSITFSQCDVDPSWLISPVSLNITYNSSDFPQGTVCPGADPFIDPIDAGTPTAEANDPSPDCAISELAIDYQDSWSSSDSDNDCVTIINRLWKATYTAANGGTGQIAGTQEIEIIDDVPPILTCPSDVSIDLSTSCDETDPNVTIESGFPYGGGVVTSTELSSMTDGAAFDNCDTALDISYSDGAVMINQGDCPNAFIVWERTWTIEDNCGMTDQCIQLIRLFDNTPPLFTSLLPDFDENMMITACDVFDPAVESISGYPFNESSTTIVSENELESLGGFVEDNCKDDYPLTYAYIDVYIDLPGNCPGELGQIFRVWTATDHCGNVGIDRQEIFLYDNIGPEVSGCPIDVEIFVFLPESCDQNNPQIESITGYPFSFSGTTIDDPSDFPGTAIDNCDGANIASVSYQDAVTQIGCQSGSDVSFEITRTWSLFDACGNATTCEQLIQLIDNEAPVLIDGVNFFLNQDIVNPIPMVFETVACEMEVAWIDPTAADVLDNCESFDDLVIWQSHTSPFLFREGITDVEYVFRDACGNQTSVVWQVVVICVPCTPQNVYYLCSEPPTWCDLSVISSFSSCTPPPIGPEPIGYLCGDTEFIENPTYFEFVAAEESISIIYLVENCANDMGLQFGVIDPCNPLVCYDDSKGECRNGFGNILANNLTVGNIYQIIIDGCGGDQCEYTISIATGPFMFPDAQSEPPDSKSLTSLSCNTDDLRFCVGQQVSFFPEGFGDASFAFCWSIDNQVGVTPLNIQPNCGQTVVPTPQGMAFSCSNDYATCGPLELQFDQIGTYKLCLIEIENGCDHLDFSDYCWDIEVVANGPIDFGTHYVCQADLPWNVDVLGPNGESWPGPALLQGQELIVDTDYCDCTYEYMIDVRILPQMQGEGDIRVCFDDKEDWQDPILDVDWEDIQNDYVPPAMGSEIFVDFGSSQQGYDGDYCDTMVFYNVYVYDLPGQINVEPGPACDAILSFEIDTLLFPEFMDDDDLDFVWRDDMNNTVDVGTAISVTADGVYTLEVEYEIDEFTLCTFVFSEQVVIGNQALGAPVFTQAPTQTCLNSINGLVYAVPASTAALYTWTVINGTFTPNATGEQITVSVTDANLPLQVSVFATSMCGVSPTETVSLNVVPAPIIDLLAVPDVCIGQIATINSALLSGTVDDYFWIVDDPSANWDMLSSGNQSSLEVSWPTPGVKTFSLYIDDLGGCESNIVTAQVNVLEALSAPIATCNFTSSNSVSITWTDIVEGDGTTVNVTSGQTGTLNGNEYIVTGLTAGEVVDFSLQTIASQHPCGDSDLSFISCEASECNINPMISSPEDLICLDGTQSPFQLVENNGFPDGMWEGNGVSANGIFDPSDAGPGTSTISYTVEDLALDCSTTVSLNITVFDVGIEDFTINMDSLCVDEVAFIDFQNNPGVSYSWDFGLGNNNPSTINTGFELSYDTPGLKYIELTAISGAACESVFGMEVYVNPPLDFGGIFCDSVSTDSVLFSWSENPQVSSYEAELIINGMSQGILNPIDIISVDNIDEGDMVEVILTAFDAFGCNDVISSVICIAQDCPDFEIDISASSTVECWNPSGLSISLAQMTFDESGNIANGSGEWIGNGVDPVTGLFIPNGPGQFNILYRFEDDASDCTATEEIQIQILDEPSSDFSVSQEILCVTEDLILTYNGDYDPAIEFNWSSSLDASDYTIIDNQDGTFVFQFNNAVSGTVSLETVVGSCFSDLTSQSFTIEDLPELPVITCETSLSTVLFSWDDVPCASGYIISINGQAMPQTQNTSILIEDLDESEMVNIELEVISSCPCDFPNTLIENCSAQACEPATISYQPGVDQSFCETEIPAPFLLIANVSGVDIDGSGSFQWLGNGVDENGLLDFTGFNPGVYTIDVTYVEGGCSYMSSIDFEIFEEPNIDITVTDAPCPENPVGMADFSVTGSGPFALSISNESIVEGSNELMAGTYLVSVEDAMGCIVTEEFEIGINSQPFSNLDGPGFIKVDDAGQFSYTIGANPSSVSWSLNGEVYEEVDCLLEDCNGLELVPELAGEYELCVTAFYGQDCSVTDCRTFLVANIAISNIYIPNVFNPDSESMDNQGLNLFVTGAEVIIEEVNIFDRWGSIIYNNEEPLTVGSGNYGTIWDGNFGDKEFMTGVYVYLVKISIDGQEEILSGDISVIK